MRQKTPRTISSNQDVLVGLLKDAPISRHGWLASRQFIATEDFTVADILMTHVLDAGTRREMLEPHANLLAYRARCTERAAWKKTVDAYNERVEAA